MKMLTRLRAKLRQIIYKNKTIQRMIFKYQQTAVVSKVPLKIDHAKRYENVLNTLKHDRTPLSIKFEHSRESFVSIVLDVDLNRQFIIIDELNSSIGHHLACNRSPFVITAKENGILIFFHTKVIDYGTIDGISFYRLAFPNHIEYLQRRVSNRLTIPNDIPLNADFLIPRMGVVRAKISDISLSGMKLILPKNVKNTFEHYTKINHCRIISPFLPTSEFTFEVKHCTYDSNKQKTQLGCQFAHIDNVGLKFLSALTSHINLPMALK